MKRAIPILLLLCIPLTVSAATIHVPGDQPTIQAGIDAAVNGDTVLVADGTYTGDGNRDIDFLGKAITVKSKNGPGSCIIDCEATPADEHYGFMFNSNEGLDSILQGFTITNACHYWYAAGINCLATSPTIVGNILTGNEGFDYGGAIACGGASPVIASNIISDNVAEYGGGILCVNSDEPLIINNLFVNNVGYDGGGYYAGGGGICCWGSYGQICSPIIINNTFVGNSAGGPGGGGIAGDEFSYLTVTNCIFWENTPDPIYGWYGSVTYCLIDVDPIFATGPLGDYYLSQIASGQGTDSPCLDAGSDLSENICYDALDGTVCLDQLTTRTDQVSDSGQVDLGYHYPDTAQPTVAASLNCNPSSGTLPFISNFGLMIANQYDEQSRRIAGRVDLTLGNGQFYPNWRAGYTNLQPGQNLAQLWPQNFPSLPPVIGDNVFVLRIEDVTPSPYNQPPYPPAGDTDTASCTVTGIAP